MRILLSLLVLVVLPATAVGQSLWRMPYQPNQITVETALPTYETDRFEGLTGAAFVTGTYLLSENLEVMTELPFARAQTPMATTTALGNPYVGLNLASTGTPLLLELGARLPLGTNNAAFEAVETVADPGRTRAFGRNERGGSVLGNMSIFLSRRTSIRLRSGFVYSASENAAGNFQRNFRLRYGVQWWRMGDRLGLGLTFTGAARLNKSGSYGANSLHYVGSTLLVRVGLVQLGVIGGVSLDNVVRDVAPGFVGLTVSTHYRP